MCIRCCCVSELHGHLYPYHNVWPETVKNYIVFSNNLACLFRGHYGSTQSGIYISVSVSQLSPVIEIRKLKLKKNNNSKMKNCKRI